MLEQPLQRGRGVEAGQRLGDGAGDRLVLEAVVGLAAGLAPSSTRTREQLLWLPAGGCGGARAAAVRRQGGVESPGETARRQRSGCPHSTGGAAPPAAGW